MRTVIIIFTLLTITTKCWSMDHCLEPNALEKEEIKKIRLAEIEKWSVESKEKADISIENISITQSYKKGSYILAEHSLDCCFESFIVLYKIEENGPLKSITTYNGYDNKGIFIGFDIKSVKKYFKKYVPNYVKPMIDCWKKQ